MNPAHIRSLLSMLWLAFSVSAALSQSNLVITGFQPNGLLTCSNLVLNSTCRVEWASSPAGPWTNTWDGLTGIAVGTNTQLCVRVPMCYRVVMTVPAAPQGNTNTYTVYWCQFHWPQTISMTTNDSIAAYARLYIAGLTDISRQTNDPAPNVVAQLGYGPPNTAPAGNTNWTWISAAPNSNYFVPTNDNNTDEYYATLTIPKAGSYHALFRFSGNAGATWVYAGTSGGAANGTAALADAVPATITP